MLRTRMAFTGAALKAVCKVGASVATTVIAAVIFAALPKATVPTDRPVAELTSGGKFAARIPGAESGAQSMAEPRAAVPIMAETSAQTIPLSAADGSWGQAAKPAATDKPVRPRLRLPLRGDARRPGDVEGSNLKRSAGLVVAALGAKPALSATLDATAAKADDGMTPRILSSARFLWSITASAGGSLLSRIIP